MSGDHNNLANLSGPQSLTSQIRSLDILASHFSSLVTKAEWESQLPLDSSVKAKDAESVRINVGGEWWVDMTPSEGVAWVRRRKIAVMDEHAKIMEGWKTELDRESSESANITAQSPLPNADAMAEEQAKAETSVRQPKKTQAVKAVVSETAPASVPKSTTKEAATEKASSPISQSVKEAEPKGISKGKGKSKELIPEISSQGAEATKAGNPEVKSLASALSQFMESQNALAQATGKSLMPSGNPADVMINEEGLPIHEIREDENGKLLNDLPVSEADGEIKLEKEEKEDFWSQEAIARREALRRKVFDDPSDSEDESADETPSREAVPSPSIIATPPTPSSQTTIPVPEPTRRTSSSSSSLQPKSILKSSAPRKKSVSFDSSVPVPPDSPGHQTTKIGGSMFPNPVINIETGIQERAVPVLNAPKRSPNRATFEEPFAGFKSGFLGGSTNKAKVDSPAPVIMSSEPNSIEAPVVAESLHKIEQKPVAQAEPKKKSLFAQRQSDPPSTESKPTFPAMSTSTHTSSVKNEIIEHATPVSQAGPSRVAAKDRITGKTAGVASTVTERSEPIAGPSRLTSHLPPSDHDEGYDDGEVDEDDDDSFYADDDDDEYDLDDALLAREVALAYHQNRAYSLLGQQNARSTRSSEDNPEGYDESYVDGYGSEGEEGGVMLGIPQISMLNEGGMPSIVNPTPDDLRRFVRVGKLDNGKLVLAPGEDGWSDEDEGRDVKLERNREEIKSALLGKGGPAVPKVQEKRRGDEAIGMPPTIESAAATPVQSAVKEKRISSSAVQKEVADPPKKVSRFKAARMG